MSRLAGRVAIVTGAGRGLGRAHALLLAAEGAAVVVNDLGGDLSGEGADPTPAQQVVAEITDAGGQATVSGHDVSDWEQAAAVIELARATFGDLHVVVNNAGILRDRTLANLAEDEWDAVLRVHLKGHAAMTRHAMAYWRERSKAGTEVRASLVHTTSVAGFTGNFGQAAYASAKLAIVALSRVAALEGERYGVRSNAVSPSARTRLEDSLAPSEEAFDRFDPGNVSPLVAWLADADCPATAQVFQVYGDRLLVVSMPSPVHRLENGGERWTPAAIGAALEGKLLHPPAIPDFVEGIG
jgi:NAD(P)-dependent dehydrogenase (short-subunit alcohol dehydrogenase family)